MSADCFPDQVSAPLASTLMTRSTVRLTCNRVAVRALRPVGVVVQLGESCTCHNLHQIAKDDAERGVHRPLPLRKIEISAGPSRVAFLFFGQCKLTCFLSADFGRGQAQYLP